MMEGLNLTEQDTLNTAWRRMARAFASAGLETPEVDARFLMQGVMGLDAGAVLLTPDRPLGDAAGMLNQAVRRRLAQEPVSRILGRRAFYGRDFEITPEVLDPRPDTETIIEAALAVVDRKGWRGQPIRIADIGTGSGAILITLLAELPQASGLATDISREALEVARRNAVRHGVDARFVTVLTRGLDTIAGPFQLVVSNPPYIPEAAIAGLAGEVRLFDPLAALDGGPDGLTIYREISCDISEINEDAVVVLEVGAGQDDDVVAIFESKARRGRAETVERRRDLGGHVRCVTLGFV